MDSSLSLTSLGTLGTLLQEPVSSAETYKSESPGHREDPCKYQLMICTLMSVPLTARNAVYFAHSCTPSTLWSGHRRYSINVY